MVSSEQPKKKRLRTPYRVVASISILALMVTVVLLGNRYRLADRKARTEFLEFQVIEASLNYKCDYGSLPSISENSHVIKILCGDNPHKIEYLMLNKGDLNSNGELVDSWGTPFRIVVDASGKVLILSAGADETFGTSDDIGMRK